MWSCNLSLNIAKTGQYCTVKTWGVILLTAATLLDEVWLYFRICFGVVPFLKDGLLPGELSLRAVISLGKDLFKLNVQCRANILGFSKVIAQTGVVIQNVISRLIHNLTFSLFSIFLPR